MTHAIIDLGSNTIRLSIYSYEDHKINTIFTQKEVGGLAGFVANGVLNVQGIEKACDILKHLKDIAMKFVEPKDIHLFATASLRNIKNQSQVAKSIETQTGLHPQLLTGEDEASLDFMGVTAFTSFERGLMVDIGGASTELIFIENYQPVMVRSLPVGCLSLYMQYVHEIIPSHSEKKKIKKAVIRELDTLEWGGEKHPLILGIGGTLRAVSKITNLMFHNSVQLGIMDAKLTKDIFRLLKHKKKNVYHAVYKCVPERTLTIVPGLIILRQIIKRFGCEKIAISPFGVREGFLCNRVLKINENCS